MSEPTKRGRGRPRKNPLPSGEIIMKEVEDNPSKVEETVAPHSTPKRPKRSNIAGRRNILTIDAPKGYVGRWVLDSDNGMRIRQLLDAGYMFLEDKYLEVGEVMPHGNRQSTTLIARRGNRTGEQHYYMIIPQELFDEAKAEKLELVDDSERAMKEDVKDYPTGKFEREKLY